MTIRRVALRRALDAPILLAALIGLASPAIAADDTKGSTETLISGIAAGCKSEPGGTAAIAPADLRLALVKAYPIDPWSKPDRDQLIAAISTAGLDPGSSNGVKRGSNEDWISRTGIAVHTWVAGDTGFPNLGPITITQANGAPLSPGDFDAVLRTIFLSDANPRGFQFLCKAPDAQSRAKPDQDAAKAPKPSITIAKEAGQLGKLKADDQKAGEISLTDDRVKKNLAWATTISVGLRIPLGGLPADKPKSKGISVTSAGLIPFVSYDRQGGKDPTDKSYTNNLSFGIATNGYLHINDEEGGSLFQAYYSLNGRYETDDGFHSSAWLGEAQIQPILAIAGNTTPWFFNKIGLTGFGFKWSTTGVFDHSSVTDPWKKQALIDTKKYTRLGGDLSGAFLLRRWKSQYDMSGDYAWSIELSTTYSQRWNIGSADGSAHLWSSKLSFAFTKNYSFSLGYDQGKVLDSLDDKKQWKVTIDLKR